jgi:hypothetical protein
MAVKIIPLNGLKTDLEKILTECALVRLWSWSCPITGPYSAREDDDQT